MTTNAKGSDFSDQVNRKNSPPLPALPTIFRTRCPSMPNDIRTLPPITPPETAFINHHAYIADERVYLTYLWTLAYKILIISSCGRTREWLAADFHWKLGGSGTQRGKKTSTCAVSALLRTRIVQGCLRPGFWIPLRIRWACKHGTHILAPSGYSIGSSKAASYHEHRRGCRAFAPLSDSITRTAWTKQDRWPGFPHTPYNHFIASEGTCLIRGGRRVPIVAIVCGILLVPIGWVAYDQTGREHVTALIPLFLGGLLILLGASRFFRHAEARHAHRGPGRRHRGPGRRLPGSAGTFHLDQ